MENIETKNAGWTGIASYAVNNSSFQNIYTHDNYAIGFHPGTATRGRNKNNTYQNIYVWNNGQSGFDEAGNKGDLSQVSNNIYDNIQCWDNGEQGLVLSYQKGGILSNSFANGNGKKGYSFGDAAGIYIFNVSDITINNCSATLNQLEGLYLSASSNVRYTNVISKNNNVSDTNYIGGIIVKNGTEVIFTNCQSYDDRDTPLQDYGLRLSGTNLGISLVNCKLLPNKVGEIYNPAGAIITVITEEPGKWSGLGMNVFSTNDTTEFDNHIDELLAVGITHIKTESGDPLFTAGYNKVKNATLRAIAKGAIMHFGVTQTEPILTASNWSTYVANVLDAAQWAQDNGISEFKIGNELEYYIDGTTLTQAQLIVNLKTLATQVQTIFTNGKIWYSCGQDHISDWTSAGKGDIDILASNVYMEWDGNPAPWKAYIDALVGAFGADGIALTEFNLAVEGIDAYSEDEEVQAAGITEMLDYIIASGMTKAYFFMYADVDWISGYNVLKADETYRLMWNSLLNSN